MKVFVVVSCVDCNSVKVFTTRELAEANKGGWCNTIIKVTVDDYVGKPITQ